MKLPTRKHLTLPETNVAPENRPSGKGDSYWKPPFSGAMLVSGRVTSLHRSLAKSWNLPGRRKKPPPADASAVGPAEDRNINVLRWKIPSCLDMGVSKNRGVSPKMDGENNGKPCQNGWFGGKTHYFWKHPYRSMVGWCHCQGMSDYRKASPTRFPKLKDF